jgi:hypothetical protein
MTFHTAIACLTQETAYLPSNPKNLPQSDSKMQKHDQIIFELKLSHQTIMKPIILIL